MRVTFWGTRGSIATPGPGTVRYGGNTSCIEVRSSRGTLIVLDCGTGAHGLGQALACDGRPQRGHLLITHTHWDHIQGFPFFLPIYNKSFRFKIYGPMRIDSKLEFRLHVQMSDLFFPVNLSALEETIRLFEPRFRSVELSLISGRDQLDRVLRIRIEAVTQLEPSAGPIVFETALDPATRTFSVTERDNV